MLPAQQEFPVCREVCHFCRVATNHGNMPVNREWSLLGSTHICNDMWLQRTQLHSISVSMWNCSPAGCSTSQYAIVYSIGKTISHIHASRIYLFTSLLFFLYLINFVFCNHSISFPYFRSIVSHLPFPSFLFRTYTHTCLHTYIQHIHAYKHIPTYTYI